MTLSQENAALQAKLEESQKKLEENHKELEETREKLKASDASLADLRKLVIELLASVFGKLNTHLYFCLKLIAVICYWSG